MACTRLHPTQHTLNRQTLNHSERLCSVQSSELLLSLELQHFWPWFPVPQMLICKVQATVGQKSPCSVYTRSYPQ